MFIRHLQDCPEFIAGDNSILRELLHPDKADLDLRYSFAHAIVRPAQTTLPHRLRESIRDHNERAPGGPPISISIGLQVYDPGNPSSFDRLISQADTLMYEEKKVKKGL